MRASYRSIVCESLRLLPGMNGLNVRLWSRTLDDRLWRIVLKSQFSLMTENSEARWCVSLAAT
jgi:hypothetical protein